MHVYHSLDELPPALGPSIVAIGNFDGVHRGHLSILADVCARAQARGARAIAITFDPHPLRVLRPQVAPRLITPLAEKLRLLAAVGSTPPSGLGAFNPAAQPSANGLYATLVLPFTRQFSELSAEAFASGVLAQALGAVEVHEGDNFRFGYQAQAGMQELRRLGQQMGFAAFTHPVLSVRGLTVASSQVRALISDGALSQARALLGRPFSILSTPARGRGIGTRLLVPTINLAPYEELLPANGVYITRLRIGHPLNDGAPAPCFNAVTNAGNRPTFGEDSYAIESYLLDYDPADPPELTPETPLELSFLARLRSEQRFPSPEALKAQILRDVAHAKRYLRLARSLTHGRLT
ncbi:MAG TPA: bifunctional riboflavin kinase/FMN adenylyltransferase [Acidobacteriaceae bacterium]